MNIKKPVIILNIILVLAVIGLYVLYFIKGDADKQEVQKQTSEQKQVEQPVKTSDISAESRIAYVNFDTVLMNYAYARKLQRQLEDRREEIRSELQSEASSFQEQVSDLQQKVQKGLITSFKAKQKQKELQQQQQQLQQRQSQVSQQIAEEQQVTNRKIIHRIRSFLKEYNKTHNYKFIISNSFGGPLLYAEKSTNITEEIVEGLNERYNNQQSQEE